MHFSRMCTIHCSGHLLDGVGWGSAWGDICLEGYLPDNPPPPMNRIMDRCKNITLLTLCCRQ